MCMKNYPFIFILAPTKRHTSSINELFDFPYGIKGSVIQPRYFELVIFTLIYLNLMF